MVEIKGRRIVALVPLVAGPGRLEILRSLCRGNGRSNRSRCGLPDSAYGPGVR